MTMKKNKTHTTKRKKQESVNLSFDSMANLSSATGIPLADIKRAKKLGCTAFRNTRIDLYPLLHWLFKDDDEDVSNWSEELCRVKTLRERIRLAEDEGRVMDFSKVVEGAGLMMSILFGRLDRMANQLPPSLKGLDELAIKRRIEDETEELRRDIKAKFAETTKGETVG